MVEHLAGTGNKIAFICCVRLSTKNSEEAVLQFVEFGHIILVDFVDEQCLGHLDERRILLDQLPGLRSKFSIGRLRPRAAYFDGQHKFRIASCICSGDHTSKDPARASRTVFPGS
jgi:hypothetical protein